MFVEAVKQSGIFFPKFERLKHRQSLHTSCGVCAMRAYACMSLFISPLNINLNMYSLRNTITSYCLTLKKKKKRILIEGEGHFGLAVLQNTAAIANGHVSHCMETSGKTECTTQVMGASSELIQQTCLDIFPLIELKPRQAGAETLMRMRGSCLELCGFQQFSIS